MRKFAQPQWPVWAALLTDRPPLRELIFIASAYETLT